jgi:SAM-dependent methyltransferase
MRDKAVILEEVNRDLPSHIDWKQGARLYLRHYIRERGRDFIEHYSHSKPFATLPEQNSAAQLEENIGYLSNFLNTIQLLRLPPGARVLDVACGGGWVSHFMTRLGYRTFGFDIAPDFIDMAKRRITADPLISIGADAVERMFAIHDIEVQPLGPEHRSVYDAVMLESCLHHFVDPIAALAHIGQTLAPDGVMVVIEGENRSGPIRDEFRAEMEKTGTLERPFPRRILNEMLELAGAGHVEYLGAVNGWFSMNDPKLRSLIKLVEDDCERKNIAIAAKTEGALAKLFPWRRNREELPITFRVGVYDTEASGWRWAAPFAQIAANEQIRALEVLLLSEIPVRFGREQEVFFHDTAGLRRKAVLKDGGAVAVPLGPLEKGEVLTMSSGDFFVPAHHGGNDPRQLSFALKIVMDTHHRAGQSWQARSRF